MGVVRNNRWGESKSKQSILFVPIDSVFKVIMYQPLF